ncbi:isocitrate lyase/phosphoenolpyruvate mutase family protein [Luteimonas sp. SJ-92]|uniref:Isocitrate lyase/phosphoenolpyruvate mutase family protein n=1 Tax=Luteimonas salinisoli TaxID=2752307 RepID=A0A853JC65_9GAMM|nr:isocitrate lyase/phosphoenolpyruvate mutase family protein [Luteimonas salinisoli]NZA26344.1 isocitrate lyase/phosphoenolpyruvate mutase family protein [Luteimonas salinisoli]
MNDSPFHVLHQGPEPLMLANAWDAGSARLVESLGARAIATTSAGMAWANGYPDGDLLPPDRLAAAVEAIARVVAVPLTVDMEGGYADDPAAVAATVARIAGAGAAGINLEDGLGTPERLAAKIEAVRARASRDGVAVFVNARTDVYLRGLASGPAAVEEVLRRAEGYRAAGADGLFVPGLVEAAAIATVAKGIAPLPLNLMLLPGLPPLDELRALGVRRLSAGAWIAEAAYDLAGKLARDVLTGTWDGRLFGAAGRHAAMNDLLANR